MFVTCTSPMTGSVTTVPVATMLSVINSTGRGNVRLSLVDSAAISFDTTNMSVRVNALTVIVWSEMRLAAVVAATVFVMMRQRTVADGTRLSRNQKYALTKSFVNPDNA